MSKKLSLSIIIPVYNEEDYIKDCLRAIESQTEAPDEVIVVDNNSTDNTVNIAKQFPFVRIIKEKKQGLFFSRNTGMKAAKGDVLGRIDADTFLDINWVSSVKKIFKDPGVKLATGPLGYHDQPLPRFTQKGEAFFLRLAMLGDYKFVFGANMAIRRNTWKNIVDELCNKPFLFEDIDLAIHLGKHGITPTYSSKISGYVSSRRFDDNPIDFFRYIGGHTRTHRYHGKWAIGAHFAEFAFGLLYVLYRPFHKSFDPKTRRLSLKKLIQPTKPRPDPMRVKHSRK